MSSIAQTIAK